MAEYDFTNSQHRVAYAQELFMGALERDPFVQFQGATIDNIVVSIAETARDSSRSTIFLPMELMGLGVRADQLLDENMDEALFLPYDFKGGLITNAVPSPVGKVMDRTNLGLWRESIKPSLMKWFLKTTLQSKFYAISDHCTNIVSVKRDETIAKPSELAVGDVFDTSSIDEALKRAKNGYKNSEGVFYPPLIPYSIEKSNESGVEVYGDFYVMFVAPNSLRSLRNDPVYQDYQTRKAQSGLSSAVRGFAGEYNGAILIEQPLITMVNGKVFKAGMLRSDSPAYTTAFGKSYDALDYYKAGDNTVTEVNFLLGCGACAMGFDLTPDYNEDTNYDSGRRVRAYIQSFFGFSKVRFMGESTKEKDSVYHDKDFGVIAIVQTIK